MIHTIRRFIRLHQTLVLYLSLLCVGFLSLFIGLVPAILKSVALVQNVWTLKTENGQLQKKVATLNSLSETDLEKDAEDIFSAIPNDKSISTLLSTIEILSVKHGLYISAMDIEGIGGLASGSAKTALKSEGSILTETLSLQGELNHLRDFLDECVRVRRLMRVSDMVITSMPRSSMVTAKLVIEVFYLPLPTTIGKPGNPLESLSQKELTILEKLRTYPIIYNRSIGTGESQGAAPVVPAVSDPFAKAALKKELLSPSPLPSEAPVRVTPFASPSAILQAP